MPAPSCTFTYDGGDALSADIVDAESGHTYSLVIGTTGQDATDDAAGSTLTLTIDPLTGLTTGNRFVVFVYDLALTTPNVTRLVGATIFTKDELGEYVFTCTWDYDGADTVTLTLASEEGENYFGSGVSEVDPYFSDVDPVELDGDGTTQVITFTFPGTAGGIWCNVANSFSIPWTTRFFTAGISGEGFPGNPSVAPPTPPPPSLFFVAFDDPTLEANPTWTALG